MPAFSADTVYGGFVIYDLRKEGAMVNLGYIVELNNLYCRGHFGNLVLEEEEETGKRCFHSRQLLLEPLSGEPLGINVILEGFWDSRIDVADCRIVLENRSGKNCFVSRADVSWYLDCTECTVNYYTSGWGREFEPVTRRLLKDGPGVAFGTYSGRSTKGCDSWIGLETDSGAQCASLAWSGNWDAHVDWIREGRTVCAGMGITSYGFSHALKQGEKFEGAEVILTGLCGNMEETAISMRRFFRTYLSSFPDDIRTLPFPYNGWWPYEDQLIDEKVMLDNARIAAELGCTHATMDAGWFGEEKEGEDWVDKRGDWRIVNQEKFPSGMKALGEHISGAGVGFGIWCEIEAAGPKAALNEEHPEFIAGRDGVSLGSICMGSEKAREWAMGIIDTLVEDYGAAWIKLDFNLDQGMGCDCEEHGHGKHDGLYAHVKGYYEFLDRVHAKYPQVILENCSSGGLRLDLGLLSRTRMGFLSDPDYTEHHQQCFWGAASYIHPSSAFHFSWSQTRGNENICKEPIQADMPLGKFDYIIRSVMTGMPAVSYRLTEFPKWCLKRLAEHIAFYRKFSVKFILNGDLYRLTRQPMRDGRGERWCAYQYLAQNGDVMLFVFRLAKGEAKRRFLLYGMREEACYEVTYADEKTETVLSGAQLLSAGLEFSKLPEEGSEIVLLRKID